MIKISEEIKSTVNISKLKSVNYEPNKYRTHHYSEIKKEDFFKALFSSVTLFFAVSSGFLEVRFFGVTSVFLA